MSLNTKISMKKEIPIRIFLYIVLFIPLIPLEGLAYIAPSIYDILYLYTTIPVLFISIVMFLILLRKTNTISKPLILLIIIAIYSVLLTIKASGSLYSVIGIWMYSIILLILCEYYKWDFDVFIGALLFLLELYVLLNFVLILIFPNGMNFENAGINQGKIWILGYKSSLQYYVFPLIVLTFIRAIKKRKYFNFYLTMFLAHFECIVASNTMLLVGLLLWDIVVIFQLYRMDLCNKKIMIITSVTIISLNIVIVFLTTSFLEIPIVKNIMLNVLHKDATFSMRIGAWQATINAIRENMIWGHGYTSKEYRLMLFNRGTAHAHNLFLELWFETGIIGVCAFAMLIYGCLKKLYIQNNYIARILFCAFTIIFIMYIFENLLRKSSGLMWLLFWIAYNSELYEGKIKK